MVPEVQNGDRKELHENVASSMWICTGKCSEEYNLPGLQFT